MILSHFLSISYEQKFLFANDFRKITINIKEFDKIGIVYYYFKY